MTTPTKSLRPSQQQPDAKALRLVAHLLSETLARWPAFCAPRSHLLELRRQIAGSVRVLAFEVSRFRGDDDDEEPAGLLEHDHGEDSDEKFDDDGCDDDEAEEG
ncbi:MAG: hypothetical protein Q8O67_17135 [Deltaproteobacteria bacterium]|nr:hypothetical protein [Deltaproteobacteria bacterium]